MKIDKVMTSQMYLCKRFEKDIFVLTPDEVNKRITASYIKKWKETMRMVTGSDYKGCLINE